MVGVHRGVKFKNDYLLRDARTYILLYTHVCYAIRVRGFHSRGRIRYIFFFFARRPVFPRTV